MTEFANQPPWPQEQILLHELNHRVNNEFAAAISVVSLAAGRSGNSEVKAALSGVSELLHRYADVHRALQMPEHDAVLDAETYLRQLCLSISRSYLDPRRIKLVLTADPLRLDANRCWRLGMIVYELIINSARHAFSGGEGEIRVELLRFGAIAQCSIADNGSVSPRVGPGRGLKIVDELTKSLGGRFIQKFGPCGSRSILAFPYGSDLTAIAGKAGRRRQIREAAVHNFDDCPSMVPC